MRYKIFSKKVKKMLRVMKKAVLLHPLSPREGHGRGDGKRKSSLKV
jgi:hypothetical protein